MATPVVAALRARWPTATIDFAVGSWSRPMVENNPHIDHVLDCGRVGSGSYGPADWLRLVRRVRRGDYDVCLVLERSPAMALIPWLAGVSQRAGLDSDGRGFSLTHRVPLRGVQHEVDLYLACAEALEVPVADARLQFFPTPDAAERVLDLLGSDSSPLAVVHPAGGQNPGMSLSAKRWPAERFAALIRRLLDEKGMRVFLVGGADDQPLVESIREGAGDEPRVINLAGALSFDELGALLQQASLFVGNDTGAMHLAVAVGAPTVAIFGPSDPRQYGPYGSRHRAIWNPPACAPCLVRGRWNTSCQAFRCIEGVTVDALWREVSDVLP